LSQAAALPQRVGRVHRFGRTQYVHVLRAEIARGPVHANGNLTHLQQLLKFKGSSGQLDARFNPATDLPSLAANANAAILQPNGQVIVAGSGVDRVFSSIVRVAPFEKEQSLSLPIRDDPFDESEQTLTVTLNSPENTELNLARATISIVDDDEAGPAPGNVNPPIRIHDFKVNAAGTIELTVAAEPGQR